MNKFFLMTRGRTGSTAVIDELDKSSGIRATQELFLKYDFEQVDDSLFHYYNIAPPFDVWKEEDIWQKWLPVSIYSEAAKANRYLKKVENLANNQGSKSFGFKVLSFHFTERPFLNQLLKKREYSAIYLTRNVARQVLSGMVASKAGVYSVREDIKHSERHEIELDEFQWMVEWEKRSVENDLSQLTMEGFPFVVVTYEEFCSDRTSFYDKVFQFLGLPPELPPPSDWKVIIKDIRHTIVNYDAVAKKAAELGTPIDT